MSGYGTFSKQKAASATDDIGVRYGVFDTPKNIVSGLVSKNTKQAAEAVDHELLNDEELMDRIIEEERVNCPPDLSIDEWNEMYLEITQEFNRFLAL